MQTDRFSRREFLRAGTVAAATVAASPVLAQDAGVKADKPLIPKRVLGRTGVEVSILNQGTAMRLDDRLLNTLYDHGVRYLDTADCYQGGNSERTVGNWLAKNGRRKEMFIVSKDHPRSPNQWVEMVDKRLEALKTDYIDLFFIHQIGDPEYARECVDWPKDKAWADAADKMKKAGKIKFAGFSSHTQPLSRRLELLLNAAKGDWVDAIMVAVNPKLVRHDKDTNKALDACVKRDIGLICMKEMRGGLASIKEVVPQFKEKGLTPHAAVLSAIWTDGRFASICSHMANVKQIKENAATAVNFKPFSEADLAAVDHMLDAVAKGYCVGCDGRCKEAAGTKAELSDIARYLCYYEQDGARAEARRLFHALPPEARDWNGADLEAASKACTSRLNFASILGRASEKLA